MLAFGIVNKYTVSRAVRFVESTKRFDSLFTILNKEDKFYNIMKKILGKRDRIEEFAKYPKPEDDNITVVTRPGQITEAGDEYHGEWSTINKRHGFGLCMFAAACSLYEGYWKDD